MRKVFFTAVILFIISACKPEKQFISGGTEYQKVQNAIFKDASKSPLKKKDLKDFKSLDFFDVDSSFVVNARLKLTPNTDYKEMPTTSERVTLERVYGVVYFNLKGKAQQLNVYQSKEPTEGNEDHLFMPFIDDTNGETTYGGGRYMDLSLSMGTNFIIDFNKAYNPYCAYNPRYSCPIVPLENSLNVAVTAGVKNFKH